MCIKQNKKQNTDRSPSSMHELPLRFFASFMQPDCCQILHINGKLALALFLTFLKSDGCLPEGASALMEEERVEAAAEAD